MRTISGIWVNIMKPDPATIKIEDIAHSLARQCRFNGHMEEHYSVARHCLNCAFLMEDPKLKLGMLLHDASEAYLTDVVRPVKYELTNYKTLEDNLMQVIAAKYRFDWPVHPKVHEMDEFMLELEWDNLILRKHPDVFVLRDFKADKEEFLTVFKYYQTL